MEKQYGAKKGEQVFYATAKKQGQTHTASDADVRELKRVIDGAYISASQGIAEEHMAKNRPDQWRATDADVSALRDLVLR